MKKRGISLIVLIVTMIVIIILAVVVILTISKNNPIESAREAAFKEDIRTFQDELAMYIAKDYTSSGGQRDVKISATSYDGIKNYIPSFSKKYEGKFIIENNKLKNTSKLNDIEKNYAQNLNLNKRNALLPDDYQQVEYIESTGTQYIDTGLTLYEDYGIDLDASIPYSSETMSFIGASNDGSATTGTLSIVSFFYQNKQYLTQDIQRLTRQNEWSEYYNSRHKFGIRQGCKIYIDDNFIKEIGLKYTSRISNTATIFLSNGSRFNVRGKMN